MRLQHLEISNFRCFEHFELALDGESLNLVAANAGGKSSVLRATEWALSGARGLIRADLRDPAQQLLIIATISEIAPEHHGTFHEALRFQGDPTLRIGIRAVWDEESEDLDVRWGFPDVGWNRVPARARDALPLLRLPAERDPARLLSFAGARSILAMLLEAAGAQEETEQALAAIDQAGNQLAGGPAITSMVGELRNALAATIPEVGTAAYTVGASSHTAADLLALLDLELAHLGPPAPIARQSTGLAQLTTLTVTSRLLASIPATLLLLDEPENSLDPHAQRATMEHLRGTGAQVLAATKSPSILAGADVRRVVRLTRGADGVRAVRPAGIHPQDAERLRRFATPLTAEAFFARHVVLVEGITDYQAVRLIATKLGRNLDAEGVAVLPLDGGGTLKVYLELLGPDGLDLDLAGLCDADYEQDWRSKLAGAGLTVTTRQEMEAAGFFVADRDLEDELVAALGTTNTQVVISNDGAAGDFQQFANSAGQQGEPLAEQLRAFVQKKKTRWTPQLAAAIAPASIPPSIAALLAHV
jgi:AAA domain, putative AbiEii toxin, Type IV TA system